MDNKHKLYTQKLTNKGIKVYPLQNYINAKTKILHKCQCGNNWCVMPSNVLDEVKCKLCSDKNYSLKRT